MGGEETDTIHIDESQEARLGRGEKIVGGGVVLGGEFVSKCSKFERAYTLSGK